MTAFRQRICMLLAVISVLSVLSAVSPAAAAAEAPEHSATAVVIIETETGKVLYRKNADQQLHPASTTKVMTLLLAVEAIEAEQVSLYDAVTVSSGVYFDVPSDASIQDLRYGEVLSFRDILYCVAVASACEASNVVAEHVSGSVSAFVELMNTRAQELGCTGTTFVNTHGITAEGHMTTANDLAIIYQEAMKHELFMTLCSALTRSVDSTNKKPARSLISTNKLISPSSEYYYEYCTGGKTGTTTAAGSCLVSSADNGILSLVCVILGDHAVTENGAQDRYIAQKDAVSLYEWAFSSFAYREVLSTTYLVAELPVEFGNGADSVLVRPQNGISALVSNDLAQEDLKFSMTIYSTEEAPLTAPIFAGDVLGEAAVSYMDAVTGKDIMLGTVRLVANTDITLSKAEYAKWRAGQFFSQPWLKWVLVGFCVLAAAYVFLLIRYVMIRRKRKAAAKRRAERRQAAELKSRQAAAAAASQSMPAGKNVRTFRDIDID